jgi:hypothetical protein
MTTALAGYLAIGQIAQHLDLTLPDDIAAGEPVTLGIRSVRPDGRSHHDPSFRWPWPGNWTPRIDADASAAECSHGLHIALGWRGLSATGPVHVCQIVGYRAADVAHVGATKLRVSQAAVLDVWDVHRMVRDGNLVGANLSGADLRRRPVRRRPVPRRPAQRRPERRRPARRQPGRRQPGRRRPVRRRPVPRRPALRRPVRRQPALRRPALRRPVGANLRSAYHDKWTSWPRRRNALGGRWLTVRSVQS